MDKVRPFLVVGELVVSVLLMAGVLLQTPKATGLGGSIGGGDSSGGGGYRTRRGIERQIYWTTWVPTGVIGTCPLTGCPSGPRIVARAQSPYGIALDKNFVYFTTRTNDGAVLRVPK